MLKHKIGISIQNPFSIPYRDFIPLLKRIGFDAISPSWQGITQLSEIVRVAKECDLTVQSLHAPYKNIDTMWNNEFDTMCAATKKELISVLDACFKFKIPILVLHTWIGFDYDFNITSLNFKNFDEIVEYAKQKNIKIAFENTEGEEYLFLLMERYKNNDTVGFCWDSGHEICYNHSMDLLSKYGDRLIMTHLNDNLGISSLDGSSHWTDDLHLLPFDGISDWNYNVVRLKKSKSIDILNFELKTESKPNRHENDAYREMGPELFFTEAYKRGCKIASKFLE